MPPQTSPPDQSQSYLHVIPVQQNLIDTTCEIILEQHAARLPDLSAVTVLLPDNNAIGLCRQILLQKAAARGYDALLGPDVAALSSWLNEQVLLERGVVNNYARELLLVDALQQHTHIYGHGNPWMLSDSLLELFDELTRWHVKLPESLDDFIKNLFDAYGNAEAVRDTLGREALLVHTLWYAMHQQLNAMNLIDHHTALLLKLGQSIGELAEHRQLYFCGANIPTPAELQWHTQLINRQQLHVVTHDINCFAADNHAPSYIQCLDMAFDHKDLDLKHRATQCLQKFPVSPLVPVISVYCASDAEDEALAIDIQVRQWLLQGKTNIGIVTENRKLARRIRALLERANIAVEDNAGWPLSTTSAATVLERWLESIEEDFHYRPLLDCLKSPFFLDDNEDFLQQVYILEQHIIIDENTPGNIDRYLKHIKLRANKLPTGMDTGRYDALQVLIQHIAYGAKPLLPLTKGDNHTATQFIDALLESLDRVHVVDAYQKDDAGIQLLAEINQLKLAATLAPMEFNWTTFRSWLGLALERFNFKVQNHESTVKLLTLNNSEFYAFDALVLAGAEKEFLPRHSKPSPFFNDNVRSTLNIPTQQQKHALTYYYFRRLLLSVPFDSESTQDSGNQTILVTRRIRENDEDIIASPWISALQSFHQLAYGHDLSNPQLGELVNAGNTRVQHDHAPLPIALASAPKPQTPAALIPTTLSASGYQQLIDCPYQFFAARCLRLAPPDTVREALQKSDYGEKIHQCLEAFHSDLAGLPGPFAEPITPQNREQAEQLLNDIAAVIFSRDIEDNFMHRGWLKRWQTVIPHYIDWQIQQQFYATPYAMEVKINKANLDKDLAISGRIDRIDTGDQRLSVIDYKTGKIPSQEEVSRGEAVQLPFYLLLLMTESVDELIGSLLDNPAGIQAMYVDLGNTGKVQAKITLTAEELASLAKLNKERLLQVVRQISHGEPLPAWGDNKTCEYCPMDGLCRKQTWAQ